jgi:hypothetical protein
LTDVVIDEDSVFKVEDGSGKFGGRGVP